MGNTFSAWRAFLVTVIIVLGLLYSAPNLFGEDPSVQISGGAASSTEDIKNEVIEALKQAGLSAQAIETSERAVLVRFSDESEQLKAKTLLRDTLSEDVTVALNLAPATPSWLSALGGSPMKLGLDLRGGVHFLMQVDIDTAIGQRMERYLDDFRRLFRQEKLRYSSIKIKTEAGHSGIDIVFREEAAVNAAYVLLRKEFRELSIGTEGLTMWVTLSPAEVKAIQDYAIQQNIITLRNRVNEIGVAEPIVQRTGADRIVVELPGVQDTAQAKRILGTTATVEMRAVDYKHDVQAVLAGKSVPGSKVYYWKNGRPELLKNRVILTGEHITGAVSGFDQDGLPAVNINLDAPGGKKFSDFTGDNIGKPLSVVFVEQKSRTVVKEGVEQKESYKSEYVISVATINSKLGRRFQIHGLDSRAEASELALLLRAGSLAAPIEIIEERTIGPSLGQDNIDKGTLSVQIGLMLVLIFMALYYRLFGIIADVALALNLVLIVALLSLIPGATLTLPGIAGIVLTVGMAVDANVLIFQRIREELANGSSPLASIHAGYEKAFSTIADANITTLIAALVLFAVGTGPIKGFAITLSIGIVTSMFTAIVVTRIIINRIYRGKKVASLSI